MRFPPPLLTRFIILGANLLGGTCACVPTWAAPGDATDDAAKPVREARESIDQSFRESLSDLAAKCDALDLPEQAQATRQWPLERDPRRGYLFVPEQPDPTQPPPDAPVVVRQWLEKFLELRRTHAEQLLDLARRRAGQGRGADAYQLLHEVLRDDPQQVVARRALDLSTGTAERRIARRPGARTHPRYGWTRNRYWYVESEHYRVLTNHSVDAGVQLAEKLEAFHSVWRQLFFDYWSNARLLENRLAGGNAPLGRTPKLSVVLFRDRDEYVAQLQPHEPQIAMSLGYYMKGERIAFFYQGDASVEPTWYHEATHQLFQEWGDAVPDVGERWNFWAVEAIAVYLESLTARDGYFTVGGFDADRLQYARARALSGEYYLPLAELTKLGRESLQRHEDIRRIYSQAAGLAHFLMDGADGELRGRFVLFLSLLQAGRDRPSTLAETCRQSLEELDAGYHEFLGVDDQRMRFLGPAANRQNLALGRTEITDAGGAVGGSHALQWLDLGHTRVTDAALNALRDSSNLRRLNLEATGITDQGLAVLGGLTQLEELDLSRTAITDDGLSHLSGLRKLKVLWLSGTQVTDAGLRHLRGLRSLETLRVDGSRVTEPGLRELAEAIPGLKP